MTPIEKKEMFDLINVHFRLHLIELTFPKRKMINSLERGFLIFFLNFSMNFSDE